MTRAPWWRWPAAIVGVMVLLVLGSVARSQKRWPPDVGPAGGPPRHQLMLDPSRLTNRPTCNSDSNWSAISQSIASTAFGTRFQFLSDVHVTGVHFYTAASASTNWTCRLWTKNGSNVTSSVASATITTTAAGEYDCNFATPYAATSGTFYKVSVYNGATVTSVVQCNGFMPTPTVLYSGASVYGGYELVWGAWGDTSGGGGDVYPNSNTTNVYPVAPRFTVP